jgi:hypothetical protein
MITCYRNVFEPNFCNKLYEDSIAKVVSGEKNFTTNYFWPSFLVRSSAPVLISTVEENVAKEIYAVLISKGIIHNAEGFVCLCYAWTRGSYISWHDDSTHETAITIYLNPHWELNWGGLFLYKEDENTIKAVEPKFNTAVVNENSTQHSVSIVANDATLRMTLQIFKPKKKK